ncbi:salt tolerance down-regulator-domain-containing protein [Lipomyces mesembrius]
MTSISTAAPLPPASSAVNGIPLMSDLSAINMESSYTPKSTSNSTSNKKKKKKGKGGQNATASANSSLNEDQHVNGNTASLERYELSTNGSANMHGNPSFVDEYASEDYEPDAETSKKSKKKKKKKSNANNNIDNSNINNTTTMVNGSNKKNDRIWNTNTNEERERIKDFWLSLGEEDRRSLVKVEKEAVLRKMKEQQKHSCSCSVCGRKRTAIEKELEVLYDAYYEELEQYANHQQKYGPVPPPSLQPAYPNLGSHSPALVKELQDDEDDEDDLDDLDDDDYSESDQPPELLNHDIPRDFFNFGNSLTVQGGILTVADDLLKNDGKKFIEMMEQLAERRMAREEEALATTEYDDDDDYDDEEDDEDYEDDEDDDEAVRIKFIPLECVDADCATGFHE